MRESEREARERLASEWRLRAGARDGEKSNTATTRTQGNQRTSTNRKLTSFFFFNFPENWSVANMWRAFKWFGDVGDVYIARKRLANGMRFGFVRYKNLYNVKEMERKLNEIWIGMYKLKAFLANNKRMEEPGHSKRNVVEESNKEFRPRKEASTNNVGSFRDVVMGGQMKPTEKTTETLREEEEKVIGEWESEEKTISKLKKCLVGKVTDLENVEAIKALCRSESLAECSIRWLGGRSVLLTFEKEKTMQNILNNKTHGLHHWVKDLMRWTTGFQVLERLVSLKISGIPLQGWNQEVFGSIACKWRKVLELFNCDWEEGKNLENGTVLIEASTWSRIDETKLDKSG